MNTESKVLQREQASAKTFEHEQRLEIKVAIGSVLGIMIFGLWPVSLISAIILHLSTITTFVDIPTWIKHTLFISGYVWAIWLVAFSVYYIYFTGDAEKATEQPIINAKMSFVDKMGGTCPTIMVISGIIMAVTLMGCLLIPVTELVAPELISSLNLHIAVPVIHVVAQLVFFGGLFYHEEFYSLAGRSYRKRVGLVDIKEMGL